MEIELTVIIKAKPEFREEVAAALQNMVRESHKEEACLQYDLHQGRDDQDVFIFHERWQSQAGLDVHNEKPYIKAFQTLAADKLAEKPVLHFTKKWEA
ncbi:putative quinol monooxygenase [Sphingobacterium sp. MYb382]|uniref:putative quinol monooxygenase n=1 Tax=Sphingobacterium sp. MYb382 TaxID=2745278 RepID=UPI00309CA37C